MKFFLLALLGILISAGVSSAQDGAVLKTDEDKLHYSLGYQIGNNFKQTGIAINNTELFEKGMKDGLTGAEPALDKEELMNTLMALQQKLEAAEMKAQQEAAVENLSKGQTFLAENAKREGVKTLPSGLQYEVIEEGSGPTPKASDTVSVHYKGTLMDGTEFDSSYSRNQPATFPVNGVIKGWTEALQLMKTGAKWKLFIPPALAYGESGAGPIPPNSPLIFEVELLSIS